MANKFEFDQLPQRRGTGSAKWDEDEQELIELWVADMDFVCAPAILDALKNRLKHGIFGYNYLLPEYYAAICSWALRHNQLEISKEQIIPTSGVIPALSAIFHALTLPGQQVIVQTPAYNGFYPTLRNAGLELLENPLKHQGDHFELDLEDLERKACSERARVLLLANPHNPTGRLWTSSELRAIAEIAYRHKLVVISDEIHCDIRPQGSLFTPFYNVMPELESRIVTCISASKSFNLAGLQNAQIICKNPEWRAQIDRAINIYELCEVNVFGSCATIAAFTQGDEWLEALNAYIRANFAVLKQFVKEKLPYLKLTELEATYLSWLDCRALGCSSEELGALLIKEGVRLSPGSLFGTRGEGFMRLNLATSKERLLLGLERLKTVCDRLRAGSKPA
ncbi:MAG: pyridoxal phosphate-dependent aminotransferase [Succinivibrio sp.]|nr:pyridoxal phosphate-dependent aminotransferase [Succinivibrio sp.]